CQQLKLTIQPPHLNHSDHVFTVNKNGEIIYGLGAIKGLGEGVIEEIIATRTRVGHFTDLMHFCQNMNFTKLTRKVLEILIGSGAVDGLGPNRATMWDAIDRLLQLAGQTHHNTAAKQQDLFATQSPNTVDLSHLFNPD